MRRLRGVRHRAARRWTGVRVICHHRIADAGSVAGDRGVVSADAAQLDRQLQRWSRDAEIIRPEEFDEASRRRGRALLLTFDDGYADALTTALPVLLRHDVRAAFFVTSGYQDDPRPAWWDELAWMARSHGREAHLAAWLARYKALPAERAERWLEELGERLGSGRAPHTLAHGCWLGWDGVRALRDAGMTIGAHTHTHPVLARCDGARQEAELRRGAERIHAETGVVPRWLAYPVGSRDAFTAQTRALADQAGYTHAFSFYGGSCDPDGDPHDIRRSWPVAHRDG